MRQAHNEHFRYGSADFANTYDIDAADMFTQTPTSLFLGFFQGKPLWYDGAGGMLLVGGARSGKLRDILAYNLCTGIYSEGSLLVLDMKGELAAISQNQTADQKYCAYWNPSALHRLPQMRINPVDYIRKDSPTLHSDVKVFAENMIPRSGSMQGEYFEMRAREYLEAFVLTLVEINGVLTLPDLYHAINLIPINNDEWLAFAFEMHAAGIPLTARVEGEIASSRDDTTGGFRGILGELFKSFSCLSDPVLMDSVSPPYSFSFADLCSSDQFWQFYMMCPAEFIHAWAPVIKSMFVAAMIYKSRAPQAPRQTWILDECAQLRSFPLVVRMFTYGAGIGIRPWAVFQSTSQMNDIGVNAKNIITSSAGQQSYFALRDIQSSRDISDMLGAQTLEFNDPLHQSRAQLARQQLFQALMHGEDPLSTGLSLAQFKFEAQHRTKQRRPLQTPDEVMNANMGEQFIFTDDVQKPILANRAPYYEQGFMAGRFHPNPYHPPLDRVKVRTRLGHRWRKVIEEPVPKRFADYPQYADGKWSYIR